MRQPSDIIAALEAFDGTHTAPLKDVLRADLTEKALATLLAEIPGIHEVPATWLIKALAEAGRIGSGTLAEVFERLPTLTKSDAVLHVLQCAQHAPDAAPILRPHLPAYFGAKTILLRVWVLDAYCRAAPPEEDLTDRIRQGLRNRSAAIRARSRALAQEFGVDLENGK
ncbi:hypothetical protein [Jannaschia sp. CCS1]|uniref:hypothetical protein n=1 Tax=Jannaschia sp. (strain CCS1) TaxID=290400 RepID=UPI000053B00D|nr:hypothetical protein [Jannaschia sp. CCS1]ABD56905.1 hypothetical protein Jann_3988 [Jannaschia sp. CCS1]